MIDDRWFLFRSRSPAFRSIRKDKRMNLCLSTVRDLRDAKNKKKKTILQKFKLALTLWIVKYFVNFQYDSITVICVYCSSQFSRKKTSRRSRCVNIIERIFCYFSMFFERKKLKLKNLTVNKCLKAYRFLSINKWSSVRFLIIPLIR